MPTGHTSEGHNWIGSEDPLLTITEYSDYECPYCRRAHDIVRRVVRERKDWLRLVHVHVPLDQSCNRTLKRPFHRHACDCARAAICADRQDRFWEMNDALFLRRCGLDAGGLTVLASNLGLDTDAFRECMQNSLTETTLQKDLQECQAVAEECRSQGRGFGTPTFTIDGQVVVGLKKKSYWVRLVNKLRREKQADSPASR
jgi:protein-disulfide isomerase